MDPGTPATICSIRGMGGLGKTELLFAIAQRLAPVFSDGEVLVELHGVSGNPLSPEQALISIIRAFAPKARPLDNLTQLQEIYRAVLKGKHVLILADDAKNAAQLRALIPPSGCALLITTRNRFMLPGMKALDLTTLSEDQSIHLLLTICPRISNAGPHLAQFCGYLPLALRVSASLLASDATLSVVRYQERLAVERERLSQLRDPDDPELDVDASLQLSYSTLDVDGQIVLCQLSIFPANFDIEVARAAIHISNNEELDNLTGHPSLEDILSLLHRRSLLEWDVTVEQYRLHDIVRAFAAARLGGIEARQAHIAAGNHYRGHLSQWNSESRQFIFEKVGNVVDVKNGLSAVYHYFQAGGYSESQNALIAIADMLSFTGNESVLMYWLEKLARVSELAPWLQLYRESIILKGRGGQSSIQTAKFALRNLTTNKDRKLVTVHGVRQVLVPAALANTHPLQQ